MTECVAGISNGLLSIYQKGFYIDFKQGPNYVSKYASIMFNYLLAKNSKNTCPDTEEVP